jgi:FkbM family methyltransferase
MADEQSNVAAGLPYSLKQCKYGNFLYNRQDVYIGRSLETYGEYVDGEIRLLMAMIEPGDFVVEAGANMGADTVPLARRVGVKGHVLAIEPQRIVHQLLCANVALNRLSNVTAPWCAVGDKAGEAIVPPIDYGRLANFGGVPLQTGGPGERVPLVPIDQFELRACALLKIDVEGMELAALRGAAATIKRFKPVLYIENNAGSQSPPLIRHLLDLGYYLFWHTPPLFNPRNFAGHAENIFGDVMSCNMLCIPPGHARQSLTENMRPVLGVDDVALESQRGRP